MTKTITLKDLIKFHGHFCGGLVESASALRVAFDRLYPDGIIDRTDLRIVSNNSACGAERCRPTSPVPGHGSTAI
ncbi:MAG: formylmethanofuran dehydrogenase subunit E family protein [Comamonadaceae bacterium]|nr:formylmethanofuran dehydrogenase subunit E family protein [Comamonadaceae bacterium]